MRNILVITLTAIGTIFAQTVYEVTPGTKGNEINITVANISETNQAMNVTVRPHPTLSKGEGLHGESITFHQSEQTIDLINPGEEKEVNFTFDVNRNVQINHRDTIEFMITNAEGIMMTKQFIFSYIGPKEFKLEQNFPNPFNPTTTIQYNIPETPLPFGKGLGVRLVVYDILGSEVITLVTEEQQPGYYEVQFNANNFASGMYVYRLVANKYVSTKKMMILK